MIFRILAKNVANITKAAFYVSRITVCHNNDLVKKNSTVSEYQGKNLRISAGKSLEEISEGTNCAKKGKSNHLLTLGEKVSNFSPKVPSRAVRTDFYVSKGWILGKKFGSIQFSHFLAHREKIFGLYAKKFFAGLSIMHSTRPEGVLGENSVWNLRFSITDFKPYYVRVYCTKLFGRVVQSESKKSRSSNFRKKLVGIFISFFLFGLWAVTSQNFDKKQWLGCRNCPLRFQRFLK